jgi:hypothetical protein
MFRLKVVRSHNWKRNPGWRWTCDDQEAIKAHPSGRMISGFSADDGFTVRLRAGGSSPLPPAQARAMDGARRHLFKFHREDR